MPSMKIEISFRETVDKVSNEPYTVIGKDEAGKDQYGYPPKRMKEETVTTEVFSQVVYSDTVKELEERLIDIIKATNGILS